MVLSTLYANHTTGIQAIVNQAQSGDTIIVEAGTYNEQVTINNAGHARDNLTLEGSGQNFTFIQPSSLAGSNAVVDVNGSQGVTIEGFTIEGPSGTAYSGGNLYGVRVEGGGSATITQNHITNIQDTPFAGYQEGIAIDVGRQRDGTTGSAVITYNTIDNYQKGGILVDNAGSSASIMYNTIVGAGPTTVLAQNGIQISRGATAVVSYNYVSNNEYTPSPQATGILVYNNSTVTLTHNTLANNDYDISFYDVQVTSDDHVNFNSIVGSTLAGLKFTGDTTAQSTGTLDATNNYWGSESGPTHPSNPGGTGQVIIDANNNGVGSGVVNFTSFATTNMTGTVVDITPGHTGIFTTIQAAVNAAFAGDTLVADAGTYNEHVTINKSLTLEGVQHGVDARMRSGAESIVDGGGFAAFYITANDVTIDGFTIQGASNGSAFPGGFGIEMASGISGTHITNDIIQNNIAGIALVNQSASDQAVVQFNLFQNNTLPGSATGTDIYADQFTAGAGGVNNVLIDSNTFSNSSFVENAWALGMSNTGTTPFSDITFTNNNVTNHGRGVYFYATTNSTVNGNTITGASHYAIGLFGSNGSPANSLFTISNNTLDAHGSGGAGVELVNDTSASAYSGTLTLSRFGLLVTDVQQEFVNVAPGMIHYGDTQVRYSNINHLNLNNTAAVNAMPGPDTADRDAALASLTADERFVQALYLDDLGRAGSKAELDAWVQVLSTGGQQAVAGGIGSSLEARDRLVKTWYQLYLGRDADGTEEMGWVAKLDAGQSEEQVLCQILGSTEFYARAQTMGFTGTADQNYVQALYKVLLARAAAGTEVAGWIKMLPHMGMQGVALGFLQSPEFRTYQFEAYYNALLRRHDDPTGLSGWVLSPDDMDTVRLGFEGGAEFYTNG
jgi:parallel beta-helix repeat protein